jgi:hypothetical protein
VHANYEIADFNIPKYPWIKGKVQVPCSPTIGMGWKGFIVGKYVAIVERAAEAGQPLPRKQCSICDLTITASGIKVDITNLPIRFWFCKHKSKGFKLKVELK